MTEQQKEIIEESDINKAIAVAYFGLLESEKNAETEVEKKTIRLESAGKEGANKWAVTLSYSIKPAKEPENAIEAIEAGRRRAKKLIIDMEKNEIISISSIR